MYNSNLYVKSKIVFYIPEIILFIVYFVVGFFASLKQPSFSEGALIFALVGYIFSVMEHRIELFFDKVNNVVIAREKMLFVKKYLIKEKHNLSEILFADLTERTHRDKNGVSTKIYKLRLKTSSNTEIFPFGGWGSGDYKEWHNKARDINEFIKNDKPTLLFVYKSCFFRFLFGFFFSFFYFFGSLYIIFPETMGPIFYQILNFLFALRGYHQ